jgi:uncharacterized lipoprotein NlpE involved in copper resistance
MPNMMRFKNYTLPIASLLLLGCDNKKEQKSVISPVNVKAMTMDYGGDARQQVSYSATVSDNKEISLSFMEPYGQYSSVLEENLLSASENLHLSTDNFKSGLNNLTDMMDAQSSLRKSEIQLADGKN